MTEEKLRESVANALNSYYGLTEGDSMHKQRISLFNSSGLCTRYTMTTSDAWCAMAVSVAFIIAGVTGIFPCMECSCSQMIFKAKAAGIWEEDDSYTPSIGDVIMYDWQQIDGDWYYFQPSGSLEGALYHTDENGVQTIWEIE